MWRGQQKYCTGCAAAILLGFVALCLYLDPPTRAALNSLGADECASYERQARSDKELSNGKILSSTGDGAESKENATEITQDGLKHLMDCRLAKYTRHLANFTAILASATFFLIVVGLYQARLAAGAAREARDAIKATQAIALAAEEANKINRDTLIASQRAWISVEAIPDGLFTSRATDADISLTFFLRNIGHTPARYVGVHAKVILESSGIDYVSEQKRLLQEIRRDKANTLSGVTIFHNDVKSTPRSVEISAQTIRRANQEDLLPIIVGFVEYKSVDLEKFKETSFIYSLRMTLEDSPNTPRHIPVDAGRIPGKRLLLRPLPLEGGLLAT